MNRTFLDKLMTGVFGGRERFETTGKETYVKMLEEVRSLVPEDRRLEYRMGEGWERLCAFLGQDVPEGDFPRVNESENFLERVGVMKRAAFERIAWRVCGWVGTAVVTAGAAWVTWRGTQGRKVGIWGL